MFEKDKEYWINFEDSKFGEQTIKGKIIEEDDFLIKVERDTGVQEIITKRKITRINLAKAKAN